MSGALCLQREVFQKTEWKFKMDNSINRRTPHPRLMDLSSSHFLPHFFSFAIESYIYIHMKRILILHIYETDFTLRLSKKYHL